MSDPESPIIDFYPEGKRVIYLGHSMQLYIKIFADLMIRFSYADFDVDMNGKKYAWQV
jgi:5'-3' exonuclease